MIEVPNLSNSTRRDRKLADKAQRATGQLQSQESIRPGFYPRPHACYWIIFGIQLSPEDHLVELDDDVLDSLSTSELDDDVVLDSLSLSTS